MRRKGIWIGAGIAVLVVVVASYYFGPKARPKEQSNPDTNAPAPQTRYDDVMPIKADTIPLAKSDPLETPIPAPPPTGAAEALRTYGRGVKTLQAGEMIEARTLLSRALFSLTLPENEHRLAAGYLAALAEETILSPRVVVGDPYTSQYTFQPRETLQKVERKLGLHVPAQILLKINNIDDARKIRAGQTIKTIRGPFHAIVHKKTFTMDLFLQREGLPRVFIKSLRVGLGNDGSTPMGMWRVAVGKKLSRAPWTPPPTSPQTKRILWGQPGYPLGTKGYWISLEGLDTGTQDCVGYGIHGTNEPDSIGREASLGCIRLADDDMELVFSLLYEGWSTVEVRP